MMPEPRTDRNLKAPETACLVARSANGEYRLAARPASAKFRRLDKWSQPTSPVRERPLGHSPQN